MNIETLLAKDFSALVERLKADDFVNTTLAKLHGADRLRLVAIGGAGGLGAALAASQFTALTNAISAGIASAVPGFDAISTSTLGASYDLGAAPMLVAVLLFALVGGATAIIVPGSR